MVVVVLVELTVLGVGLSMDVRNPLSGSEYPESVRVTIRHIGKRISVSDNISDIFILT